MENQIIGMKDEIIEVTYVKYHSCNLKLYCDMQMQAILKLNTYKRQFNYSYYFLNKKCLPCCLISYIEF